MRGDSYSDACGKHDGAGIAVRITAMPAGSTTALLAEKYGSDPVYASKCLLTNTLFSLITIPIMTLFI